MTDGRSLAELGRDIERIYQDIREIRRDYVTEKMFDARVGPLERDKASRRNTLLAICGTLVGVVASALITYMIAKGGSH